jgi:hypothetical protein
MCMHVCYMYVCVCTCISVLTMWISVHVGVSVWLMHEPMCVLVYMHECMWLCEHVCSQGCTSRCVCVAASELGSRLTSVEHSLHVKSLRSIKNTVIKAGAGGSRL